MTFPCRKSGGGTCIWKRHQIQLLMKIIREGKLPIEISVYYFLIAVELASILQNENLKSCKTHKCSLYLVWKCGTVEICPIWSERRHFYITRLKTGSFEYENVTRNHSINNHVILMKLKTPTANTEPDFFNSKKCENLSRLWRATLFLILLYERGVQYVPPFWVFLFWS